MSHALNKIWQHQNNDETHIHEQKGISYQVILLKKHYNPILVKT